VRIAVLGFLVTGLGSAQPAAAGPCTLATLHWMEGSWRDASDNMQVEERWIVGPDDRLLGSSWLLHPGGAGGVIEAMTIVADGNGISFRIRHFSATLEHAREEKDEPMLFLATDCDENFVRFDGRGDRMGERISYRRDGERLQFVGEFIHDGKPLRAEETFTKEYVR